MAARTPLRSLILFVDAAVVVAALAIAAGIHVQLRAHFSVFRDPPRFGEYALVAYLSVPTWLVLISQFGLHRTFERVWSRGSLVIDLLKLHVAGFLALSAALFFVQSKINRSVVFLFIGCSFVMLYVVRGALSYWLRYQYERGHGRTRILVIGSDGEQLKHVIEATQRGDHAPLVVGTLGATAPGTERLGDLEDLDHVLHDVPIDQVMFFPPYNDPKRVAPQLAACETIGVSANFAVELVQPAQATPRVIDLYGAPFISFDPAPKPPERLAIKHSFDWVCALFGLIVLAPLFLVVSIAILVTMGRPVFFTQERAGRFGRQFRMIKFRTMIHDAESHRDALVTNNEMTGPVFKISNDPRVTRLGAFLRKTSIDELPQLLNVLAGSMSLVGPRPLRIEEQKQIRGWHRRRLSMKPGITGVWQVSGRNDVDFEEWMRLDRQYVDQWSLGLDLRLLVRTIPAVLFGRGAR
jgi:exopolysaccharide biosynthesis polyprenyl glycosylphosphotransferase